jgi:hypothetical protein
MKKRERTKCRETKLDDERKKTRTMKSIDCAQEVVVVSVLVFMKRSEE